MFRFSLLLALIFSGPAFANESAQFGPAKMLLTASLPSNQVGPLSKETRKKIKGWDYGFQKLVSAGMDPQYLIDVFSDKRMPKATPVYFSVPAKESKALYRKRNSRSERKNAIEFYRKYKAAFREASERYGIPEEVALAILQMETRCGDYTGRSRVLPRLLRLVSTASPNNVQKNYKAKKRRQRGLTFTQVQSRAKWLEDTFFPHLVATFLVAQQQDKHPLEILGSKAGAFGLPQFLPGNYFTYGADGNGDGMVDLFEPEDAIFSVMLFLRSHGWRGESLSREAQRDVIFHYNRSEPYVDTVLAMARSLKKSLPAAKQSQS